MIQNKPEHCLLGLLVCAAGVFGFHTNWFPVLTKPFFLLLAIVGGFWALIMGHAPMVIIGLLFAPFELATDWLVCPVKLKGEKAFHYDDEIIAYATYSDRIVLIRAFPTLGTIEGRSVFHGRRMLDRMLERLEASTAPEMILEKARLNENVNTWNSDADLRRRVAEYPLTQLESHGRLLDIGKLTRENLDYIHELMDVLWQKFEGTQMHDDVIRLAIWYSLGVDKCFARKRGQPLT